MKSKNFPLLLLLVLAVAIPLTVFVSQQSQETRQRASEVTSGDMKLDATFESIGVEIKNTTATTGTLEFKKTTESSWRKGLDMWQAGGALYGSALLLQPGTTYDVRVTYGGNSAQGQITTRNENIPPITSLNATHFVRIDGNDANSGTSDSPTGAWKTIKKALDTASEGSVIQVGPGYHAVNSLTTSKRLTLKAQFPALDDNRNEINADKRSVIERGVVSGPSGSNAPYSGVWTQETLVGPGSGKSYTLYKWTSNPAGRPNYIGYSATREGMPLRITNFKMKLDWSDAKRAEHMFENDKYLWGWFYSQSSSSTIYLRLPPHAPSDNPNSLFVTVGNGTGVTTKSTGTPVNGANFRLSGFEIRGFGAGVAANYPATYAVIDHNLIRGVRTGINFDGTKATFVAYGSDHVIQYNKIVDSNMRALPGGSKEGLIPWQFIKSGTDDPFGGSQGRTGEESESGSIDGSGGAQRVVLRHNTFDGTFNGIGTYENGYDKYTSANMDVHDNTFQNFADDALLEHEPNGINQRIWNNRLQYLTVMATMSESNYGPHYIFRNSIYRWGVSELVGAITNPTDIYPNGGTLFKLSTGHTAKSRVYLINNTFWTDEANSKGMSVANGGTGGPPDFYLRNNIIRSSWRVGHDGIGPNNWNEDYNFIMTEATPDTAGHRWQGSNANLYRSVSDLQEYRTVSNGAANTNRINGTDYAFIDTPFLDGNLVNPAGGDLRLKLGSSFIDRGTLIPNIADNYDAKSSYNGSAPDLGAYELGTGTAPTPTPTASVSTITPTGAQTPPSPTPTRTPSPTPTTAPIGGGSSPTPTRTPTPIIVVDDMQITSLTLVNADTDQDIGVMSNGMTINLAQTPRINIRANTFPATVGSVKFGYDTNSNYIIEANPPYAMFGNTNSNYAAHTPTTGSHTVTATPYSAANATGTQGTPLTISFNVVNSTTQPTNTPTITSNPSPIGTSIPLAIKLHGIGTGGDIVNPNSTGNMNPLRTTRQVSVEIYSALNNQQVGTANGQVTYNSGTGMFTGSATTSTVLPASGYNLRISSPGYLTAQLLGISLPGVTTQIVGLTSGDINSDKTLDILDYNILVSCYGSLGTTKPSTCTGTGNIDADLFDDGNVNFIDLNLWLREFSKKS